MEDFDFLWKGGSEDQKEKEVILPPQKPGIPFVPVSKTELCFLAVGAGLLRIHPEICNRDDQRWRFRSIET